MENQEKIFVPEPSRRFKVRINRLFREQVRSDYLPHPEVDNIYERLRSKFVVKFSKLKERIFRKRNI